MDSTPLTVDAPALTHLADELDRAGDALSRSAISAAPGSGNATEIALGLIAGDLVTTLLRTETEHAHATAEAAAAVRHLAMATAVSAETFTGTDADGARALRTAATIR